MLYGPDVWDPTLIVSQIVLLQAAFYLAAGAWTTLLCFIFGAPPTLALLLDAETLSMSFVLGWVPLLSFLLVCPVVCARLSPPSPGSARRADSRAIRSALVVSLVVGRSRKCLDFVCTTYLYHLLLCWYFFQFPRNAEWWTVNGVALVATVIASELLCHRREMVAIPVATIFSSSK
jgi:hypothetical protein